MTTSTEEALPQRTEADDERLEFKPQEQLGVAEIRGDGTAPSGATTGTDVQPRALGLGPEICSKITTRARKVFDVALTVTGAEKAFVLAPDMNKGLRHYEIGSLNCDVQQLPFWQYTSGEKDHVRKKKGGIVSSVCTLADGRIAVGIINRHRVLLLRWTPAAAAGGSDGSMATMKGCWTVERKIKLRCGPYRIDAFGNDVLAVAGAAVERESTSAGVSNTWEPGSQVAMAWLTARSVRLVQCGELKFKVAAVTLADGQLIAASSDLCERGETLSYVIDAYDLPERPDDKTSGPIRSGRKSPVTLTPRWSCEFDERVSDVCAVPCKAAVYVVLAHSRRVVALNLHTGEWLVDVLDCGSSRPIRIDIAPRQEDERKIGSGGVLGTMQAAILYGDSSISVYRVGA